MEAGPQTRLHDRKVKGSVRVSCVICGSNVEGHQTPDDLGWFRELRFAGSVPDEGDYPMAHQGTW